MAKKTEVAPALTKDELKSFERLEKDIEKHVASFVVVGNALRTIRDERLYRTDFKTFEAYCEQRWDFKKSHAYRLIESAGIVQDSSPMGDVLPDTERQARELKKAPPETRAEVWQEAVATAPVENGKPKITAAHVAEVVRKSAPAPEESGSEPQSADSSSPSDAEIGMETGAFVKSEPGDDDEPYPPTTNAAESKRDEIVDRCNAAVQHLAKAAEHALEIHRANLKAGFPLTNVNSSIGVASKIFDSFKRSHEKKRKQKQEAK